MDDARDREGIVADRWAMLLPHRDLALGMVLRATGNLAEAEDCVHDAMLRLVRRDDLDPARVRSLLVRAALHIAIDHRRAATRQQTAVTRLGGGAAAEVTSPEQVFAERTEVQRMLAAVEALPRREREVMLLRLAGLTVAETAGRLGISTKSVEGAYTRARARIRLLLAATLAWAFDRLRRAASPRGEMAATAVAALLLFGPGWSGGNAQSLPWDRPQAALPHASTPGEGAPQASSGTAPAHHDSPAPDGERRQPPPRPDGHGSGPPPRVPTVRAPINAPDGIASTGVNLYLEVPTPSDVVDGLNSYPQTMEQCVQDTMGDIWASCQS